MKHNQSYKIIYLNFIIVALSSICVSRLAPLIWIRMSPAAVERVGLIRVTVRDSNEIHPYFSRFKNNNCNIFETWSTAFARAGIRLNASEFQVFNAGLKKSSKDLDSKIQDFVSQFKKRPGMGEYKVVVKKIKGQPTRRPSQQQTIGSQRRASEVYASTSRPNRENGGGESDAETVRIPTSSNGRPTNLPPQRFLVLEDDDNASQFADSINEVETSGEDKAQKYTKLNKLIEKRLNEAIVYKDRMFKVQQELKDAFDTEKWEKLTSRFPNTSLFLIKLYRPYSS